MARVLLCLVALLTSVSASTQPSTESPGQVLSSKDNGGSSGAAQCKSVTCCGLAGTPGRNGIPGHPGPPGGSGPPGRNGLNGLPGPPGRKGDIGLPGRRGKKGTPGVSGYNGTNGMPGFRGKEGPRGMRGAEGPIGPAGPPGQEGRPGPKGEPGEQGWLKICTCQRNEPAQVFYLSSGHWMSEKSQFGFHDVTAAQGEYNVNVVGPITYILHVGGDWVNENSVTLHYRLHCTHGRHHVKLPNSDGHRIYKFTLDNRLESETFTHVTTKLDRTGRWRCKLQIRKRFEAFYRWDSQYGEISLVMF